MAALETPYQVSSSSWILLGRVLILEFTVRKRPSSLQLKKKKKKKTQCPGGVFIVLTCTARTLHELSV